MIIELKTLGNIALVKLLEDTSPRRIFSPESNLILQFFEKGCLRTVTRYTGLSVAVLYQIGSDAERQYPDPDRAGVMRV